MALGLDPVALQVGPIAIRWYGVFMAISMALGLYYFLRDGRRRGLDEDDLYNIAIAAFVGGLVGARAVYVLTNWGDYAAAPWEILRVDHGGLSFHGAIVGGGLGSWLYARRRGIPFHRYADLAVPGIGIGIVLVRIGNLFNGEVLGRPTELWPWGRHPAQLYGSAVGLVVLAVHNLLARRPGLPEGTLFWAFALVYTVLRGFVEETFRDNPLYVVAYVDDRLGVGLFTLTQLVTPPLLVLAAVMLARTLRRGSRGDDAGASGP